MTIAASGEISLGVNADVTRSVACELLLGGTTQICMEQAAVRALAARTGAGTSICFQNFYGRTKGPDGIGCVFGGGYYTGVVCSPANYYLILAPNASGCAECTWKTSQTFSPNTSDLQDGYANTRNGLANANHPAGNWTATRSINGFSDWYLPAMCELYCVMKINKAPIPAGQGYHSPYGNYWSSNNGLNPRSYPCQIAAYALMSATGPFAYYCGYGGKSDSKRVRAVRRTPV